MAVRIKLFFIVLMLVAFGIVMIYNTSAFYAYYKYGDYLYFFRKSLIWTFISLFGFVFGYYIRPKFLKKISFYIFILSFILLLLVFTPIGISAGGARRWINLRFFMFQPSEFMKLSFLLYFSSFLSDRIDKADSFKDYFFPAVVLIGISALPILAEPDFGTTFILGLVGCVLLIASGARLRYIIGLGLLVLPFLYLLIFRVSYRMKRIMVFLDPWKDAKGAGYQIVQSFVAFNNGGISGIGFGESRQKLFYLPEAHTDFIFSIVGEELGFIGALFVVILFLLFVYYGFKIAMHSKDVYEKILAFGIVSLIGIQAYINMCVVTGLIPTKGLPLPFISYGGTSLLMFMILIGILLGIDKSNSRKKVVEPVSSVRCAQNKIYYKGKKRRYER